MKKLFLFFLAMGLVIHGYSQTTTSYQNQLDLIKKSENQNKVGWILLGGGLAMAITSIAIPTTYDNYTGESNSEVISVLGWASAISIAVSIPFFLSSGSNARTAAKLGLQNQALNQPFPLGPHPGSIPSLSLKIPL